MTKIDPASEEAEVLFYQQFMTEMHQGLTKIRSDLSGLLFDNVGDDVQFIAFTKAIILNSFIIVKDDRTGVAKLVDQLQDANTESDHRRLYSSFYKLANKLNMSNKNETAAVASTYTA